MDKKLHLADFADATTIYRFFANICVDIILCLNWRGVGSGFLNETLKVKRWPARGFNEPNTANSFGHYCLCLLWVLLTTGQLANFIHTYIIRLIEENGKRRHATSSPSKLRQVQKHSHI
jgi:hypothetical protein